jgi:hypothetical protein
MKKNMSLFLLCSFCSIFIFANSFLAYATSNQTAEANKYIDMLGSASLKTRIDAAKQITRSGLTDPKLFNIINESLLNGYNSNVLNSDHIDEMSWMCKALASSGSSDYAPTLEKIIQTATSQKLVRYAKQSLSLLSEYSERNKLINNTTNIDPNLSPEVNKYINMLKSNNITLQRDAAKSIYRGQFSEKALFDVLSDELLKGYKTSLNDRNQLDTLAWMCKALGASGMAEYKQTLTQIIENSSNAKLLKYAKQGLGMLQ